MAPKGDKPESRKRSRLASSHDTVVISISSDSDESYLASLKKQRRRPLSGEMRPAFNLLLPEVAPPSEMGENGLGISSHRQRCRPSDSLAVGKEMLTSCSYTEWAPPPKCLSTARFNGEHLWLRVPASDEELEDTASSYRAAENISPRTGDYPVKRPAVNVQSEVGENSPVMSSHFSDSADRCCCCGKHLQPPHW